MKAAGCFRELTKDIRRKRCKKRGSSVLFRFTATRTDRWSNSADILTKTEIQERERQEPPPFYFFKSPVPAFFVFGNNRRKSGRQPIL